MHGALQKQVNTDRRMTLAYEGRLVVEAMSDWAAVLLCVHCGTDRVQVQDAAGSQRKKVEESHASMTSARMWGPGAPECELPRVHSILMPFPWFARRERQSQN